MDNSLVAGVYEKEVDRESAYEILIARAEKLAEKQEADAAVAKKEKARAQAEKDKAAKDKVSRPRFSSRRSDSAMEAFFKSAMRSLGGQVGRRLVRGVLGSLLGGK